MPSSVEPKTIPRAEPSLLRGTRIASYAIVGVGLLAVLGLHLLPTLLAGLLVYELVNTLSPLLSRRISGSGARLLVVTLLAAIVVTLIVLSILGAISLVHQELASPDLFWEQQVMPVVEKARQQLPAQWIAWLPDSVDELRQVTLQKLRENAGAIQLAGKEGLRVLVHILIGLGLGAIVSLTQARPRHQLRPLAAALTLRCGRVAQAFHDVVFAQVKISLLNTALTGLFLLGLLPLLGISLPFAKSLVVLTFLVGLLPVVGNLISNTVITVVALSVSFGVGVAALVFLVVVHKLEYFLNARIVGGQIRAAAWELLLAMIVMEAAFGLPGVIAAPIFYAFLKRELEEAGLV